MVTTSARAAFEAALGPGAVVSDPVSLRSYECDGLTGYRVVPALVLLPRTAEDVAACVTVCAREGLPTPRRAAPVPSTTATRRARTCSPTACTAASACRPARRTWSPGRRWSPPRGRIHLMDLAAQGEIPLDDAFASRMDSCLGCLACTTACPSGVQYDKLIEATRPQVERHVPRPPADRLFRGLVFQLFPHPGRLRVAALLGLAYQRLGVRALLGRLRLLERLPARMRALEALLPPVRARDLFRRSPSFVPAAAPTARLRVGMLAGCAQRVFFGDVNAATVRVLAAEGCDVYVPKDRQCCGALSVHAGQEEGLTRARRTIDMFERYELDVVVANAEELGRRKAAHLAAARPDVIATANAGCLLQIRRYLDEGVPLVHPVQLIDAAIRGVDPFTGTTAAS